MNNNISFSDLLSSVNIGSGNSVGSVKTDDGESFGSILSKNLSGNDVDSSSTMDMSDLFSGLLEGNQDMNSVMQVFFGMLGLGIGGQDSGVSSLINSLGNLSNSNTDSSSYSAQNLWQTTKNIPVPDMQNVIYGEDLSANPVKTIPESASRPTYPYLTNDYTNRSASNYRQVINQFDVENNDRYKPYKKGNGDTYCNIFTWDVTRAMGAEIPHYIDPETMEPMYYPNVEDGVEMSANRTHEWLGTVGQQYGWYEVTPAQAQALANQGRPTVSVTRNWTGSSGHVQVVCPSANGTYNAMEGVTIAQAGKTNYNYTTISNTTSDSAKFKYYAHI